MAGKPSRALVLYGDGLARSVHPSNTHIHSLASIGNCGFLSLPHAPPGLNRIRPENPLNFVRHLRSVELKRPELSDKAFDTETENERTVREFAHLLDASEAYTLASGLKAKGSENEISTLSERFAFFSDLYSFKTLSRGGIHMMILFMGLKAALVTDNSSLTSFGKMIGLDVLQLNEIHRKSDDSFPSDATATGLLRLLGFEGEKCLDVSLYDSVFLHISGDNVGMVDSLIGSVMRMAQPGSEIAPRLHLSLVLSYGSVTHKDVSVFNVKKTPEEGINPAFQGLVPRQSYTMRGEKTRGDVRDFLNILVKSHKNFSEVIVSFLRYRDYCPMLVAQWQDAVTRKDLVETLSFEALKKLSGNLVIPADRFIHEVAFKLWKAPKYGA
ncbi:LOW QUALITY PROTEIN: hypothetical protein YC2023_120104 [Brassica napus]